MQGLQRCEVPRLNLQPQQPMTDNETFNRKTFQGGLAASRQEVGELQKLCLDC